LADGLSHPFSMAYALCMGALVNQFCGRAQETYELAEAANGLCTEHRIPYWLAWGPILSGWALTAKGQKEEGIKRIREGLAAYSATQAEIARPMFLALLAESCRKGREVGDGLAVVNEALEGVHRTEDRFGEPELHRLRGELLSEMFSDNYTEVESCFRQALEVSRRQNAKSFELRAAVSLSRLWHEHGKRPPGGRSTKAPRGRARATGSRAAGSRRWRPSRRTSSPSCATGIRRRRKGEGRTPVG